jgi:hypothetical protein
MRVRLFLVIGALALLFGPTEGLTQFGPPGGGGGAPQGPGGFGGGRQGGFGGMGQMDPSQIFNFMSGGKDIWVRPDDSNPAGQSMFDRTAQRMGVTNGQITRQQFAENWQQRMAQRAAAAPQGAPAPNVLTISTNPATPGTPGGNPWGGGQWGGGGGGQWGGGGGQWGGGQWGGGWGNPPDAVPENGGDDEPKKQIVYRGNNLPKDLDWFQQLDTDHDGQVGLYEWKASGRPIAEFEKRDLNGDGFITAEEIIKYEAKNNPSLRLDQQGNLAQGGPGQRGNNGPGSFAPGGGGQGNFGQGNQNWRLNFGQGNNGGQQAAPPGGGQRNNRPQDAQPDAGGGRQRNRGNGNRGGNNRPPQG